MEPQTGTEQHRHAVQLATQVLATATRARASCVLLTSVEQGAGKTALAERMRLGLVSAGFQRHVVLQWSELARVDPKSVPAESLVFIDGPALFSGVDILSIPPGWRARISGAVVVVMKRQTRRSELAEIVAWLEAAGWPPIGVVWNLHAFPRWPLLSRFFSGRLPWLRRASATLPPPVATPPPAAPREYTDLPSRELFTEVQMGGRIVQPADPPVPVETEQEAE